MSLEMHFERYQELTDKYKIARSRWWVQHHGLSEDDFDVIIERAGVSYAVARYEVIKNKPGLSTKDLAIICDEGNLCFGYRMEGKYICVHTD